MPTRKKTAARSAAPRKSSRSRTAAKKTATKSNSRKPAAKTAKTAKTASRTARKTTPKTTRKTAGKTAGKTAKTSSRSATGASKRTAAEQLREYQRKRDFERTAEPSGETKSKSSRTPSRKPSRKSARNAGELRFVIQKHDASHLHYDLRLEMDGVMKSWAVPKGPSADPSVKRLAMQVEDHPIEYNTFEGTIPEGEYGGGTVMLWDNGTYEIENATTEDQNEAAHDQYERGELKLDFHGKRIRGSYALVRTKGMGSGSKPSWLLIKHRDDKAHPESESVLTEKYMKSVESKRSMDQIAKGNRVWHSNR